MTLNNYEIDLKNPELHRLGNHIQTSIYNRYNFIPKNLYF